MTAPSNVDEQGRKIIGYQIVDESGHTVHGTEIDPFEIYGENVLTGNAVRDAQNWLEFHPGFSLAAVPEGLYQNPWVIDTIEDRNEIGFKLVNRDGTPVQDMLRVPFGDQLTSNSILILDAAKQIGAWVRETEAFMLRPVPLADPLDRHIVETLTAETPARRPRL